MIFFGLDPDSVIRRVKAGGRKPRIPSLSASLLLGGAGFSLVTLASFGVWAIGEPWMKTRGGELGLFAACALILMGGAGPVFHRLVIGPNPLARFCGLFALALFLYAGVWTGSWVSLRNLSGEWLGSLLGPAILGMTLANAFGAPGAVKKVVAVLFVSHSLGYFIGRLLYQTLPGLTGKLIWGAALGAGFGAGIGYALYTCQESIRRRLAELEFK